MQQEQKKISLPRGGGATPYQQRSKDLSQRLCVQAVARLHLDHLGQVREEVLQGETVMQGDGGGALEDQAHVPIMASGSSTVWQRSLKRKP